MNNDSRLQASSFARFFLVSAWLLPCLGILVNGAVGDAGHLPAGVGYLDSDRTLLTVLCLLGFLFSAGKVQASSLSSRFCLAFLIWSGISCLANESPFDSFLFWQIWLAPVLFFVAARPFHQEFYSATGRAVLIHLPVVVIAGMALLPILFEPVFFQIGGVFELAGVLSNWLLLLLPLLLFDTMVGRGQESWTGGVASCLSLVVIAFSFSRAGWFLAFIQVFFVLFLLAPFERKRFTLITLWIASGIACLIVFRDSFSTFLWTGSFISIPLVPLAVEAAAGRVKLQPGLRLIGVLLVAGLLGLGLSTSDSMQTARDMTETKLSKLKSYDNSSRARVELWTSAALMARAHPLLGVGPGDFSVHYPQFQKFFYYYSDSAHSAALEMAAEVGFVGLGLFLALTLSLLYEGVRPPLEPMRRVAVLGLVFGLGYAQIDLAYQLGYPWLTVALLFLYILPPPVERSPSLPVSGPQILWAILIVVLACYVLPPIRKTELTKFAKNTSLALEMTQQSLRKLPFWRHALVKNYQYKMELDGEKPGPAETQRLLKFGSSLASTHALVGERHLQLGELTKAIEEYKNALRLDPHNYPYYYEKLRTIGLQVPDPQLVQSSEKTILEKYTPEKMALAHYGHRATLEAQLHPLLFDIADSLNPYKQPLKTLPIYRYLYEFSPSPRAAYGLGISLQTLGRNQEAARLLEEARRKFSDAPSGR
jgi:O-antigen ligase